jgi:hypothetical protein
MAATDAADHRLADVKAKHNCETSWRELMIHDKLPRLPGAGAAGDHAPATAVSRLAGLVGRPRWSSSVRSRKARPPFRGGRGHQGLLRLRPRADAARVRYTPVRSTTGPNSLDVPDPNGKPWPIHFNVYELANQNQGKQSWTQEAIRKNRSRTEGISTRTSPNSGSSCSVTCAGRSTGTCRARSWPRKATSSTRRQRPGTRHNSGGEQGLNCRPHQQHVSFGESSLRPDAMRRWNGTDFDGLDHVGARPHLLDVRDGVARRSRYQVRMSRGMKPSALRHPSE